jgi:type 1 glutamine amidotransferase
MNTHIALVLVLCTAIQFAGFADTNSLRAEEPLSAANETPLRVLVFSATAWYRHPELPRVNGFLTSLLGKAGFRVAVSETAADVSATTLADYDVIVLNSTTDIGKTFDAAQQKALVEWFRGGGGIVGIHAAIVHHDYWPWFSKLAGCDFNSDSEFVKAKLLVDPKGQSHPAAQGFGAEFWYTADWTNHTRSVTDLPGIQVLIRIDESTYDPVRAAFKERGGKPMGKDHPVVWTREFEGGRFFYTELGHETRSLDTKFGRQHLIEGVRWAAGARRSR